MADRPGHPLIADLDRLLRAGAGLLRSSQVCEVEVPGGTQPVHLIELGSTDPHAPVLGLFGGVHGLEQIGIEVLLAFLNSLVVRARWDGATQWLLQRVTVVAMPLVNPGGLLRGTRANSAGVDLMRNSPVDCHHGAPALVGGQRISPLLPWYRGAAGAPMQPEAQALCGAVAALWPGRPLLLCVDCHSGFGAVDRLWFPHAHTPLPMQALPEVWALARLLDDTLPQHPYVFEPQSHQYLAHGDLWDHLVLQAERADTPGVFLPLTLEMGSWLWLKKNPRQVLSRRGLFNPLIRHRHQRVLRRHLMLLDFMLRAAASHAGWLPAAGLRDALRIRGVARWYAQRRT